MANWERGLRTYQDKNVLVLGAARSGISAAHLLLKLGARVTINDHNVPKQGEDWVDELQSKGVKVIVGGHPDHLLDEGFDLIVKNPGIPYEHPYLQRAIQEGIPIITEIELGYSIAEGNMIGITGSNGKTTTTTLIGKMIQEDGKETIVAGNIGKVFSEQVQHSSVNSVIVTELSSFQLKGVHSFRPHIGVLLNIFHHHLDYHGSMEDYVQSKMKMFAQQTDNDYAVLNWDQTLVRNVSEKIQSRIYWFSRLEPVSRGAFIAMVDVEGEQKRWIMYRDGDRTETILPVEELLLVGEHNLENVLAAVITAKLAGVSTSSIVQVLRHFRGVEHRLEYVGDKHGVKYFNDSKATNPEATAKALVSFAQPIILIAGGLERGEDFEILIPLLQNHVHALIVYGQTKERLYEIGLRAGVAKVVKVANISEAVRLSSEIAKPGDIVLLSPACASWDMYASFEERGRMFIEAVHTL